MTEHALYLLLSLAMLGVGPVIYQALQGRARTRALLNGFILVSILGLVAVFVLPEVASVAGGWAVVAALAGITGPILLERFAGFASRKTHLLTLGLALMALTLHTALDGMALGADHGSGHGMGLALAVALHRLPVGLTVWALVKPRFGGGGAFAVLAVIIAGTVGGFFAADSQIGMLQGATFGLFQAFVAGSLLHVILHHPAAGHTRGTGWQSSEFLGGALGAALVAAVALTHDHGTSHMLDGFGHELLALGLESAPALCFGFALAGVFAVWMPRASVRWISRGSRLQQASRGMVFGLPLPICSCGVVPLYQSLVQRGVPTSAAMAFLIATPELEIGAILLTMPLLGPELTTARVIVAAAVALAVGALVGVATSGVGALDEAPEDATAPHEGLPDKLRAMFNFGARDVVDDTAPWIVAGLVLAAVLTTGGLPAWTHSMPWGLDVVLFALIGMPLYVCASGATPLAAALIFAGVSPGAGIAFLISGPATNVTTFGVLAQLHGKRTAARFAATVIALAVASGYAVNLVLPADLIAQVTAIDAHGAWWQWASLAAICLLFLASIARLGPTAWLNTVFAFGHAHTSDCCDDAEALTDHHHHDHDHHDHDHHDHGCGGSHCAH